jgi:hypothetical protein
MNFFYTFENETHFIKSKASHNGGLFAKLVAEAIVAGVQSLKKKQTNSTSWNRKKRTRTVRS